MTDRSFNPEPGRDLSAAEVDRISAYFLHLDSPEDHVATRRLIESSPRHASAAEAIGHALQVFRADSIPSALPEQAERIWRRIRPLLPVLSPPRRHAAARWVQALSWPVLSASAAALLLAVFLGVHHQHTIAAHPWNNRPGPLSTAPVATPDGSINTHLDSAERLLTEVNHSSGSIDDATRLQAHQLLLRNYALERTADDRGDRSTAAVLGNLGRLLTNIDSDPPTNSHKILQLRLEMNTDGLLFDIRILRRTGQ